MKQKQNAETQVMNEIVQKPVGTVKKLPVEHSLSPEVALMEKFRGSSVESFIIDRLAGGFPEYVIRAQYQFIFGGTLTEEFIRKLQSTSQSKIEKRKEEIAEEIRNQNLPALAIDVINRLRAKSYGITSTKELCMLLDTLKGYLELFMEKSSTRSVSQNTNIIVNTQNQQQTKSSEMDSILWLEKEGVIKILNKSRLKSLLGEPMDVESTAEKVS